MRINSAKELEVYKKAYALAMDIFELSKHTFRLKKSMLSRITSDVAQDLSR